MLPLPFHDCASLVSPQTACRLLDSRFYSPGDITQTGWSTQCSSKSGKSTAGQGQSKERTKERTNAGYNIGHNNGMIQFKAMAAVTHAHTHTRTHASAVWKQEGDGGGATKLMRGSGGKGVSGTAT